MEYCQQILAKLTEMSSYFNVIEQILAIKQHHEDIGHSIDDVQFKLDLFKAEVNKLFSAPPPKKEEPPKVPAPTDQQ